MDNIKEIWNAELELLKEVDKICKKYNIKYFADSGTLLGAIRHNGFIPWDDDIDIAMLRDDYNKFRRIAEKELDERFFCQSGYNDKGFYGGMLHIRMNNTTAILKKNFPHIRYHQGIFIDIFPLDGVIENHFLLKLQNYFKHKINHIMWYKYYGNKRSINPNNIKILILSLVPQKILFKIFEFVCSMKKAKKASYIAEISYFGETCTGKRKSSWYKDIFNHSFCNTTIPVPSGYKEILTCCYGCDYMTPIKVDSDHGEVFFDIKNSYKEYLNGKLLLPEDFLKCQNQ